MDWNNRLMKIWMHLGYYDYTTRNLPEIKRKTLIINRICLIISFICTVKSLIILCDFSGKDRMRFYLIELYFFGGNAQKIFDLGITCLHAGIMYGTFYWSDKLDRNLKLLNNLDFLFISNIDDLIKYYDLDRRSTQKFIKKSNLYIQLIVPLMVAFHFFFGFCTLWCVYLAFNFLNVYYLYTIGLFLTIITLFSFHLISVGCLWTYIQIFISIEFLILRIEQIEKNLLQEFTNKSGIKRKRNPSTMQTLKLLNNFACQFHYIDEISDNLVSITYFGAIFASCCFVYLLIFAEALFIVKVFTTILYVTALVVVCSSLPFYNDYFKRKFSRLEITIHHLIPLFEGFDVKINLNNFLILNNQHQGGVSFTLLKSVKYSSSGIIELVAHSVSMMFLLYQTFSLSN